MGKDENTNAGSSSRAYQPERRRLLKKIRLRNLVINLFFFSVVGTGLVWTCGHFWKYLRYDITNDAFIDQYVSPVNIRVSGYIKEVRFREHQYVHKGDTLLILDNSEYYIRVKEAEAALDLAELNLSYTVLLAPYDGYTGRRTLEPGQYVQSGQTITYLVRNTDKWVTANYREKQISGIFIGQDVRIKVDAIPGRVFMGRVTAISEATGSKYSLVPTDNSAGNFVKVQQRIPVRIEFTGVTAGDMAQMRAGMMVVTEAVRRRR